MSVKPLILDLFCGAGGAGEGYSSAGFDIVGVDIEPQPNYPFKFHRRDALEVLEEMLELGMGGIRAVHASPPCQNDTAYRRRPGHVKPVAALIEPTRELLEETGLPFVIENVPGAPLREPVRLCGSSFGLDVRRHRLFESNVPIMAPPCAHGQQRPGRFPGATNRTNGRATVEVGVWRIPLDVQKRAMGVDWDITLEELSEAIPPAYTEHIGAHLMQHIRQGAAA